MFEELEKAIDDAFKPEEKERVKKTLWDYYTTPTHNHKLYDDYMRNRPYDEMMFGNSHSHTRPNYVRKQIKCRCECDLHIWIEPEMSWMRSIRYDDPLPYEQNIQVSNFFCSMCGERYRYYGKVKKVFTEVC